MSPFKWDMSCYQLLSLIIILLHCNNSMVLTKFTKFLLQLFALPPWPAIKGILGLPWLNGGNLVCLPRLYHLRMLTSYYAH